VAGYNAPMFVDAPAMTHEKSPMITLRGLAGDQTATLTVFDASGHPTNGPYAIAFGNDMLTNPVTLTSGYNRLCAVVKDGNLSSNPESANCTEIAFLPGP
jgi:hypothetical protein